MYISILFIIVTKVSSSGIAEDAIHHLHCSLGLITDNSCPVDGGWTSWEAWGPCTGECGSTGKKLRTRSCNNPPPSGNGEPCIGSDTEILTCQLTGCTINDYEALAHGDPVRKEEIKMVKAVHERIPALIELCFSANCAFTIVQKVLGNDAMMYWNAMNCVKHGVGCPTTGGWSHWSTWSPCTASCGKGRRYRQRTCDNPKPSDPELDCDGEVLEIEDCTGFLCGKDLSGEWGEWSSWSNCSEKCGNGIKTKNRVCKGTQKRHVFKKSDGRETTCNGASKDIVICEIGQCSEDGAWSAWTAWTPCSSDCGVGAQSRNRMCNNPSPSGAGADCVGLATEVRQCYTRPCTVKTHEVAIFSGESTLLYSPNGKHSRLLHIYLRFLPLAPFGILVRRYQDDCEELSCDFVRLTLQSGRIMLFAQISSCTMVIMHEERLEIGQWHEALVAISGTYGIMRVDDNAHNVAYFSCIPLAPNLDHTMRIGERFHGQIQQLAINFRPVQLRLEEPSVYGTSNIPFSSFSVDYIMGDEEEAYVHTKPTVSISLSCPIDPVSWHVTLVLKPEEASGTIALIPGQALHHYILLSLEGGRVKLNFHQGSLHTSVESTDRAVIREWIEIVMAREGQDIYIQVNGDKRNYFPTIPEKIAIQCNNNIFIGAVPDDIKEKIYPECSEMSPLNAILGIIEIDNEQQDLLLLPTREATSQRFSSRMASFSENYKEIPVILGQELKLSCFYDKTVRQQKTRPLVANDGNVMWLLIDKPLNSCENEKNLYFMKDNGRMSTISAASYPNRDAIEGFYSCWLKHSSTDSHRSPNKVLFTFGVAIIDENKEFGGIPWKRWTFVSGSSVVLLTALTIWLMYEGFRDIHDGHGFYRRPIMSDDAERASMLNFVLSKDCLILLGSQEAVDEVVAKITEERRILNINK